MARASAVATVCAADSTRAPCVRAASRSAVTFAMRSGRFSRSVSIEVSPAESALSVSRAAASSFARAGADASSSAACCQPPLSRVRSEAQER